MNHDEMIAVIEHHKNGGKIEVRCRGGRIWEEDENPMWNFYCFDYRIKSGPVERWAIEWEHDYFTFYHSKKSAEEDFKEMSGTVRMFKMREIQDD